MHSWYYDAKNKMFELYREDKSMVFYGSIKLSSWWLKYNN